MWAKNGARALYYLASVFYFKSSLFLRKVLPTMANLKARKIKLIAMLKIIAHPSRFRKKMVHPLEVKNYSRPGFIKNVLPRLNSRGIFGCFFLKTVPVVVSV